jgi:3'(2'), 5'-bisphosphate nucleotidase
MEIARTAGEAIMRIYADEQSANVEFKLDQSPVTLADKAAHEVLVACLNGLLPSCPVVSEEDDASHTHRMSDGMFWLLDPLDGTKEFIARNGEFTVNIALIDHGVSVLGVVYAPGNDCMYWGGAGLGAFCVHEGRMSPIKGRQGDGASCRVVASKSHLNTETRTYIDQLGAVSLVQAGSSLKFCRIAEGLAVVYPRLAPTCEWDTAAAQAVLEGAGGCVLGLDRQPLRYGKTNVINPSFVAARNEELIPK